MCQKAPLKFFNFLKSFFLKNSENDSKIDNFFYQKKNVIMPFFLSEKPPFFKNNVPLVDRKFSSCKILQDSCKKVQFLQDSWMQWNSYKILARFLQETVLYRKKENIARFLQEIVIYHENLARSCKK